MENARHIFLVLNPAAGRLQRDEILARIRGCFTTPPWSLEVCEITGGEEVAALTRAACERGAEMVVAAGGDGTVVGVANGLIKSQVPLGILPLGTGNVLARGLGIPLDLNGALNLLMGDYSIIPIDALKVDHSYHMLDVSAGISPQMMRETRTELKKRFGPLAYLWTALRRINLFRVRRYRLTIDGQTHSVLATEVLIANGTVLEGPISTIGPPETFSDKQLEVYVLTTHNLLDYARLAWAVLRRAPREAPVVMHFPARRIVSLDERRRSQLVQADGEIIGRTPVTIELVPAVVKVIVPPASTAVSSNGKASSGETSAAETSAGVSAAVTAPL